MYNSMFYRDITTPLTEEEKKIVEENKKLVWFVYHKMATSLPLRHYTADDIFSIGIFALVSAIRTHHPDKGAFSTWATKIITMQFCGLKRYAYRNKSTLEAGSFAVKCEDDYEDTIEWNPPSEEPTHYPESVLESKIEAQLVMKALDESNLTESERTVIELHVIRGMEQKQVGELLGCSQGNIAKKKKSGLNKIKNNLIAYF